MRAVVTVVTGETYTLEGEALIKPLRDYFTNPTPRLNAPLGWVSGKNNAINFAHVVHVKFIEEVPDDN